MNPAFKDYMENHYDYHIYLLSSKVSPAYRLEEDNDVCDL